MARQRKRREPSHREQVDRLSRLLMDCLVEAWVEHNPNHDSLEFKALKCIGHQVGYPLLARRLLMRGVRLPPDAEEGAEQ